MHFQLKRKLENDLELILLYLQNHDKVSKLKMLFVRKGNYLEQLSFIIDFSSLYKEDVLYQGDTRDLPEYQSQPDIPTYVQQTTKVPELVEKSQMKAFWDVFLSMTNINILNDKKMAIICLVKLLKKIFFSSLIVFLKG
jgi:hypothetical protein